MEDQLQVEGGQEEPGEHRGRPQDADHVGDGHVAAPEQAQRDQRRRHGGLDPEEDREQHSRSSEQANGLGRRPAGRVAVDDGVDREHQGGGHGHRSRDVQSGAGTAPGRGRQHSQRQQEHRDADGRVDEEDPVPVEAVREHSAEQDADAAATCSDETDEAHRLGPVGRLGEQVHHERQRHGGDNCPAEALHRAGGDQHARRPGQAARDRGGSECSDTGHEQPPLTEQVTEPAAQQQEAAEGQQVRVDDPGERRLGEAEVGSDGRERDVHDRRVEHDHQVAEAQHDQRRPTGAAVQVRAFGRAVGGGRGGHGNPPSSAGEVSGSDRPARQNSSVCCGHASSRSGRSNSG